jgi:hypothetical protein
MLDNIRMPCRRSSPTAGPAGCWSSLRPLAHLPIPPPSAVAEDAFDVVIPSISGYGFSARPKETGWGPDRIGRAWDVVMKRVGYTRHGSQGGD